MGERAQRKRFARALDDEAAQTDDEQLTAELAIVGQLRQASTNTATDQQTRHDIAARMSAKAVGTESEPPAAAEPTPPTRRALPVLLRRPWLRPVLAATLTLATALTTLAVAFSTGSTPGDALYAVKRARESTALALTFDDRAAALTQLDHAAERVTELTELATRPEQHDDIADAYRTGLSDFDQATRAAAVTLTTIGTNADGDLVDRLRQWSHRQEKRLDTLRPALAPATAHRQADSATLLHRIQQRTTQLHDRLDCYRITTGAADNLGPLPATGSCATPPKQRFDEQTTNQNDTHDHPADPEPPDDGDSSHTPRPPGGNAEEPHRRAAAPPQLPRTSKTTAPLDREPYRPSPATPEPPPSGPPRPQTEQDDVPPRPEPPDLLGTLDGLLSTVLPAAPDG